MGQPTGNRFSLEQSLEQLRPELGDTLIDALYPILRINEQRGRLRYYLRLNPQESAQAYIFHVVHYYKTNHDYLDLIQRQKNSDAWEQLLIKIRPWIYSFLGQWHLDKATRMRYTLEIAQEAGLRIVRAHYPYDCEFDAWACKITHYASSKYMQRYKTSPVVEDFDLSDADEWLRNWADLSEDGLEEQLFTKQLLLDAIEQLSEKQKHVILQFYFEGCSLSQIANDLHISANVIYKRHFDALKQLRKILEENQYKDEQRDKRSLSV